MGCVYSLKIIKPEQYKKIYELFSTNQFPNLDQIEKLYVEVNKKTDKFFQDSYKDLRDEGEEYARSFWNQTFSELISFKTIYLDKSPDLGLTKAFMVIPELKPLGALNFQTPGFPYKHPLPKSIEKAEPFYGIWDSSDFKPLIPTINNFSSKKSVTEYISKYQPGFLEKLFGNNKKNIEALNKWVSDDYLWKHWIEIAKAIEETVNNGYYIGHSMSC